MLLRDSEVARRVRTHLLDSEEAHRAASATPAPSAHEPTVGSGSGDDAAVRGLIAWLDERIARSVAELRRAHPSGHGVDEARVRQLAEEVVRDVVGRTIVPLLNQTIESHRELNRQLSANEAEMIQLRRVLREQEAAGSMAALDA